jgi:hypothetical protein
MVLAARSVTIAAAVLKIVFIGHPILIARSLPQPEGWFKGS